ncbi:NEL domain-containing protein [Ralstonia solanacearum]|uniref:NEL-type E3 ubiquitin ligase domain-containing protein n=2 Tax=Ralstonia solanacearum TaxID=305 RepID=UPI0023064745|nr:NEL-type E3 ubiquitin ligase domain-containing protein [Ralstonia solanacearum]MDB0509709.1 NEL domain-containing protein [Ralstonia solanacearum]MDB0511780.1 NEL domain-containing protein [Ralstonia solanacearum]
MPQPQEQDGAEPVHAQHEAQPDGVMRRLAGGLRAGQLAVSAAGIGAFQLALNEAVQFAMSPREARPTDTLRALLNGSWVDQRDLGGDNAIDQAIRLAERRAGFPEAPSSGRNEPATGAPHALAGGRQHGSSGLDGARQLAGDPSHRLAGPNTPQPGEPAERLGSPLQGLPNRHRPDQLDLSGSGARQLAMSQSQRLAAHLAQPSRGREQRSVADAARALPSDRSHSQLGRDAAGQAALDRHHQFVSLLTAPSQAELLRALFADPTPREPTADEVLALWAPECGLPSETVDALRLALGQQDSAPFVGFLGRLNGCASFKPEHRTASRQELGDILTLVAHNDAYRASCFDICGGAGSNCHDNVDVIFGNLRLAARDPALRGNAPLSEILSYHKFCVPWALIDDFVSHRFSSGDRLEKVLALRIRLSDILLVKTPDMLHGPIADIKLADEVDARHYIKTHVGTEANLLRSLSRSPTWRTFLTQHHPVEFTANTLLWNAALEELGAKSASGSAGTARSTGNPATFGSRTEALAQARAMPALGTGLAFRHLQENATVLVMEAMTQKLVAENAPVPSESDAHAALLEDPDWLAYLQKEHPADPAFTAAGTDARERHEQLLRLTRQEIADARGIAQAPGGAPTDGDRMAGDRA